ncbi:hypothetical protein S40288_07998 [Stachybotrys chartarum IBT 40288]|nr:hypothetical protein S40288_07998 [Stachybotrys chartarum IBT 40288]
MLLLSSKLVHHAVLAALSLSALLDTGAGVEAQLTVSSKGTSTWTMYGATTVSQAPHGILTLVYNCAKMPAICQNVHVTYPLNTINQGTGLNGHGTLQGQSHLLLHFDRGGNAATRRGIACSGNFAAGHLGNPCPSLNQPHTVPFGAMLGRGSYPAARFNPTNIAPGNPGYNTIANAAGQYSGMMWTCDEFPPASTVEGGSGARTICAPQNGRCDSNNYNGPLGGVNSEQNFQSWAHTALRNNVFDPPGRHGVYRFHFVTRFNTDIDGATAEVHWYGEDATFAVGFGQPEKRYPDGTPAVHCAEEEYKVLRRHWINNLHGNLSSIDEEFARAVAASRRSDPDGDSGWMQRRQSQRQCGSVAPCPDGSCCNRTGRCGYGNETCAPNVCISNCNAAALCSRDSLNGEVVCPLNVCCSHYGYCGIEDDFCLGAGPHTPCQEGFGSCNVVSPPSCGGNSAFVRSIGYYQLANVRERQCNRIRPDQIRTEGFTHLLAAFATINPSTFAVEPWQPDDVAMYEELIALRSSSMQIWIAIGGWTFNDAGPTRTTFSDLAMSPTRRRRFINSLVTFLQEHGFDGVDLDWEYTGAPDRGGRPEDTANYVSLIREMREVFGTRFGISMAIPTSYWYLRWFRPIEIEPYIDFFGVMSYDLHGPWDEDVRQIGRVVLGHTNVPEIANWTLPLYYDGLDPAKLNLGLAYYARGYTVAVSDCNAIGCDWVSTSRPAPCTNFGGVMSLEEIERMVSEQNISPRLLASDMMMQLTFGNQWIGYDNLDTIRMKKWWASQRCFGGTIVWSVDMYSGSGSGDVPDGRGSENPGDPGGGQGEGSGMVYIDPEVWEEDTPEVNCWPPCTFVMPPLLLGEPITISLPPYETSLDVAWAGTDGWHSTIQTTTLTIPVMTITTIDVWHITVRETRTGTGTRTGARATYYITPSIRLPTFIITNNLPETSNDGVTQPPGTRTITPPPYAWTFTPPDPEATSTRSNTPDEDIPEFPIALSALLLLPMPAGLPGPGPRLPGTRPIRDRRLGLCRSPRARARTQPSGPPPPPPGSEPENEDHEEEERACAIEWGQPIPTFRPDDSSTSSIPSPTRPPPSPSPTPDPEPPSPNPDTEEVDCYNNGQFINRALAIEALDYFCDAFEGQNGCRFRMGGNGPREECGRILRRIIDECDTSSTQFKQGGTLSSNCADWSFDPNDNWGQDGPRLC